MAANFSLKPLGAREVAHFSSVGRKELSTAKSISCENVLQE